MLSYRVCLVVREAWNLLKGAINLNGQISTLVCSLFGAFNAFFVYLLKKKKKNPNGQIKHPLQPKFLKVKV